MFNSYLMSGIGSRHYHGSRCVDVMSRRHHLSSICCYISFHVGRIGFDETLKKKQKTKKTSVAIPWRSILPKWLIVLFSTCEWATKTTETKKPKNQINHLDEKGCNWLQGRELKWGNLAAGNCVKIYCLCGWARLWGRGGRAGCAGGGGRVGKICNRLGFGVGKTLTGQFIR